MRLFATAVLTLSSLAATPAMAQVAPAGMLLDGTILDVNATGRTSRVPDIATIRAGVVTQGTTAAQAMADNAQRMANVLAALKAQGIEPRDIQTANVSLQPQYRDQNDQVAVIVGYRASNSVSVRFRDVSKAGAILDTLVKLGANQINGPSLSLDKPDAALDEARVDAVRRARAKAELYAKASGLTVVRMLTIGESGESAGAPPVMYYARSAAVADTQIASGETDVTATVTVRFLLK